MNVTELLPHRPPMLLLDGVCDVQPGRRLTGRTTIRANHFWYAHGWPPYLILESWLQSAAALISIGRDEPDSVPMVGALRGIGLGRAAREGETVEHQVEIVKSFGDTVVCTGIAVVGAELILEVAHATLVIRTKPARVQS
jgi:3-hydroxyacyl-[acyl-carrier-protein] dehydratase